MAIKKLIRVAYLCVVFFGIKASDLIYKYDIAPYLPINPIILEAGAHIGTDTTEMAAFWPDSTIYAFEPVPHLYRKLENTTKDIKNIHCFCLALSDRSGVQEMYVSEGNIEGSSSLYKPKEHLVIDPSITFPYSISVQSMLLDEWAEKNQVKHIDLLWLDMQGAEPHMLMASPTMLKTIQVIYTEVSFSEVYEGTILYPAFKAWLESQGFVVVQEDRTVEEIGKYGNMLFVRKELVSKHNPRN